MCRFEKKGRRASKLHVLKYINGLAGPNIDNTQYTNISILEKLGRILSLFERKFKVPNHFCGFPKKF